MELASKIEDFRSRLVQLVEMQAVYGVEEMDGIVAELMAVYNQHFSRRVPTILPRRLDYPALINKYCRKEKHLCPVCGSALRERRSKIGRNFLGCSSYPQCRGTRELDGTTVPTTFIKEYVLQCESNQTQPSTNRFEGLEE